MANDNYEDNQEDNYYQEEQQLYSSSDDSDSSDEDVNVSSCSKFVDTHSSLVDSYNCSLKRIKTTPGQKILLNSWTMGQNNQN